FRDAVLTKQKVRLALDALAGTVYGGLAALLVLEVARRCAVPHQPEFSRAACRSRWSRSAMLAAVRAASAYLRAARAVSPSASCRWAATAACRGREVSSAARAARPARGPSA